jgi:type IV secretory pathway protease TraF
VVVIRHPGRRGFEIDKRVAFLPGQTVEGIRLGPDDWWVIGDDPTASTDSRTFGPVHRSQIAGIARLRYWPPGRVGLVR